MSNNTASRIVSAHRVVSRFVEADTMTELEAKKVLGIPPSTYPTPEALNKLWKQLAIQNHPDRGGDPERMKQINRARDVLLKQPSPKMEQGAPPGGWRPQDEVRKKEPPKVVDTIKGVSFAHASSKVPSGVEWKFISAKTYASGQNTTYKTSSDCWCAVGQTSTHWVVVGIQRRLENQYFDQKKDGLVKVEESWEFEVNKVPSKGDPIKTIPLMIKKAFGMFSDGTIPDLPKKFVAFKDFSEVSIKAVKGSGGAALKDILVSTGMVSGDAKGVAGRKSTVEMWTKYSIERRKRMQALKCERLSSSDTYDFFVRVNGHEFKLEDPTIENLEKSGFLLGVWGYKFGEGAPKQLNRLRGGHFGASPAVAIRLLADALTSEPSALIIALEKAAEEWEPETKTASELDKFAEEYGIDAKEAFGMLLAASR